MRTALCILLVIGCCMTGSYAQQVQRRQRVTRPQNNAPRRGGPVGGNFQYRAQMLPGAYSVLLTRSLFSRDHVAVSYNTPTPRPPQPPRVPSPIILRGILREPNHTLASIEDTGNRSITWVREGDTVRAAGGAKVIEITLDHMLVENSTGRRTIGVGENVQPPTRVASALPTTRPISAVDQ